mmetsp:Transcript_17445/g.39817  ORF Transcript_17445/g.39817 Transcript_17445/m.39817 type:complete len:104 (+) Transcript_17445:2998-3309(+)
MACKKFSSNKPFHYTFTLARVLWSLQTPIRSFIFLCRINHNRIKRRHLQGQNDFDEVSTPDQNRTKPTRNRSFEFNVTLKIYCDHDIRSRFFYRHSFEFEYFL